MAARSYFGVGFLRGLNSVAEVFAPYPGDYEYSPSLGLHSDWLGEDLNAEFADVSEDVSERRVTAGRARLRAGKGVTSSSWGGAFPSVGDLEKIDRLVPGSAERFVSMAEKRLDKKLSLAERNSEKRLNLEDKKLDMEERKLILAEKELNVSESERELRYANMKRGQYCGWTLAMGAVIAAAVASFYHAPWQVSVALVGIPVLGAVQVMIPERKEKNRKRTTRRWF